MSTPAAPRSAYPVPVDELLPRARQLAADLGEVPSRNKLMSELKIGAPKAKTLLKELDGTSAPNLEQDTRTSRLHLVTATSEHDTGEHTPPVPEPDLAEQVEAPDSADAEPTPESGPAGEASEPATGAADPEPALGRVTGRVPRSWPVLLLALPAFVAIWSGWVGLGGLTGFGIVHPLPGIADEFALNTAITLPIGVETYAAYALRVWLSGQVPAPARRFAKYSALGSLALGALGQVAYHLMTAAGMVSAPWQITTLVACLPVAVLGMGAALTHLLNTSESEDA